jgi:shikimate dehydrogenase
MTDFYAVIGNPIAHSKSPIIHAEFAKQTGQDIHYESVLSPLDKFQEVVHFLAKNGYRGMNVTAPFKLEAYDIADRLTERALDAGAVNTLQIVENSIIGDNTDGAGLIRDITQNLKVKIEGARVLLIGAGGASEGVLHPLLFAKPQRLVITNRSMDKAVKMVKRVETRDDMQFVSVEAQPFEDLSHQAFDIIVNATSAGLTDATLPLPPQIFAQNALAYDMMYGRITPFMHLAHAQGARVVDGLGMLIEQAAESFYLWRGIRPDTSAVIAMMSKK